MKRLVLLCCVWLCLQPYPVRATDAPPEQLVLAFYYAWFDLTTWQKPLSDQPLTPYHSADSVVIERHVQWANQAGIDALVQAWYGPEQHNNQTEDNFWVLLDKASANGAHAAVSVDMGSPAFLQTPESVLQALLSLRERHTQHGGYLRAAGRPVIFFWKQELFSVPTWEAIRSQVDPEHTMLWIAEGARLDYLAVFDGLYLYSVAWADAPAAVLVRWGKEVQQWGGAHNASRYWVATVMPGYNDFVTGRADAFSRVRADGAFYRACWDGAIRSQADWVVITSFNEWLEGSHIEPSVNYGEAYLNLTVALGMQYRDQVYVPAATALPPTVTPVLPTDTPVPPSPTAPWPTSTLTPTLTLQPTVTLTPTATPFRLATPTPTALPQATPTFPPKANLPPAPTTHYIHGDITPTPGRLRPPLVEGQAPKLCQLFPALLGTLLMVLLHRWK